MRQLPAGLNRAWLAMIGALLLLAGAVAALIGFGLSSRLLAAAGVGTQGPQPSSRVVGNGGADVVDMTAVEVAIGVVGVILGILALAWLIAQIPRTNAAKPFRLQDDAIRGLTVCGSNVLSAAVAEDVENLPGVTGASAVLRGTSRRPELTIRVTANDRVDLARVVHLIQTEVAANLSTALETPLRRLDVQFNLTSTRRTADAVTL